MATMMTGRGKRSRLDALGDLRNYVGMLATATALVDSLANRLRKEGAPAVHGAGFSLGGWVLNLHRAFHGTGIDRYVPICDCRPLLFRYDALVDIDVHLPSYAGMQVEVIDKGHFAGQQAIPELRSHIRRATGP